MKKNTLLLLFLFFVSFSGISQRNIKDYDNVREKLMGLFNTRAIPSQTEVQSYLDTQNSDGSWPDIVYNAGVPTTRWTSAGHMHRWHVLSRAYSEKGQIWYGNTAVRDAVYSAIEYWAENDFTSSNFPGKTIYPPQHIAMAYLNIERVEPVPQSLIDKTQFIIDKALKPRKVGGNNHWRSTIAVLIALFYDDVVTFEKQMKLIYAVYTQPVADEGIQTDGSFKFHGNEIGGKGRYQIQFGNYGTAFIRDLAWLEVLLGTPYAFDDFSSFELVRNYLAHGIGWTYWDDEMDFNLMPRSNYFNSTFDKANKGRRAKEILIKVDPSYASEYEKVLTWPNQLIGFKAFWEADLGICRRSNWYASVTMSSERIVRGESINGQNQQGLHQSDGVLMFQQSGKEYENIGGVWDWKRLPGVTCDQGITKLQHPHYTKQESVLTTTYAGALSTKEARGMGAMIHKRKNLNARKSYFFDKDVIVCLGSDITGPTESNVFTSIQQSFHIGDVKDKNNNVLPLGSTATIPANDWIYHDNAVYQSINPVELSSKFVQDDWINVQNNQSIPTEGNVFSLWIDHGQSPSDDSYAYFIYPQADGTDINDRISKRPNIIVNNKNVHAIDIEDRLYAAFFEAGSITTPTGTTIEVDIPCLLAIDGEKVFVADPNHDKSSVTVKINGEVSNISLPTGHYTGKQEVFNKPSTNLSFDDETGEIAKSVYVYPNPARDFLFIPGVPDGAVARISDTSGRAVNKQKVENGKVDLFNLQSGLHFILLQNEKSQSASKFVKE